MEEKLKEEGRKNWWRWFTSELTCVWSCQDFQVIEKRTQFQHKNSPVTIFLLPFLSSFLLCFSLRILFSLFLSKHSLLPLSQPYFSTWLAGKYWKQEKQDESSEYERMAKK